MLLSFFKMPRFSASFIIQYAALSFTEPNGLNHSSFAYSLTFFVENEANSISGVLPIRSITSSRAEAAAEAAAEVTIVGIVGVVVVVILLFCLLYRKLKVFLTFIKSQEFMTVSFYPSGYVFFRL